MKTPHLAAVILFLFLANRALISFAAPPIAVSKNGVQLAGTQPLTESTPLSDRILDGASSFLDHKLEVNSQQRTSDWHQLFTTAQPQLDQQLAPLRQRLRYLSGSADSRSTPHATIDHDSKDPSRLVGNVTVQNIHWQVFENYAASGLCIADLKQRPKLNLIWIPDSLPHAVDPSKPANLALDKSIDDAAVQLAQSGVQVFIVYPISNAIERRGNRIELTDREYAYRTLFVLGRHPVGIEVQSTQALADWLSINSSQQQNLDAQTEDPPTSATAPICVAGDGDGALSALIAVATDSRFSACMVRGDFGNRDATWARPISHNIFDLLSEFGDAQLACLIQPRTLIIDRSPVDSYTIDNPGAAPGRRVSPTDRQVADENTVIKSITRDDAAWLQPVDSSQASLETLAAHFDFQLAEKNQTETQRTYSLHFPNHFRQHQLSQLETLSDYWIQTSRGTRQEWIDALNTSSLDNYQASISSHRRRFENEVIGRFDDPLLHPSPKSRLWKTTDRWTGWELEVDVYPGLVAGGILLVPNDVSPTSPRPAVVCVHGLEGTPLDTIEGDHRAYRDFARKLCEQGFVVFCPQQLYLGKDRFRVLQRKANPLGKTLFSLMLPQHKQLLGYLKTLPYVDAEKIAFYGLSYGGKSAMRIPAVIEDYCAVICSGDFNEWVLKNASTRDPFSYVWTPEFEIFEFDLAGTFNYAEMAALICPRPFMVERGHFDGVAIDPWVAFEYAKVRHLYAAKLGIPDRTEIEWFPGPHTINGKATFGFLRKHLIER